MRKVILDLIKQGRSKSDICKRLEITKSEFNKHLSIHNSKNYHPHKSNSNDRCQRKDLTDSTLDIGGTVDLLDDNLM